MRRGEHDRGKARFHVVRAAPVHPAAIDPRRERVLHALDADRVQMGVQHERATPTGSTHNAHHAHPPGVGFVELNLEPRPLQPVADEGGDLLLTRTGRDEIGVYRVDRYELNQ